MNKFKKFAVVSQKFLIISEKKLGILNLYHSEKMLTTVDYCCPCTSSHNKPESIHPPHDTPDTHKASPFWYGAVLFYYFACAFSLALTHGYWGNVLFFPLIFLYTLTLVFIWKRLKRRGFYDDGKLHLNDLVRCYCHAFFGTAHFVLWIQLMFSLYISYRFNVDTSSNGYNTYFIFFAIVLQGMMEEYIGKGIVMQHSTHLYLPHEQFVDESYLHNYVWFGLCTGLGMSTMVDGVAAVCIIGYLYGGWTNQLMVFLIRSLIGIPFQGLLGALWGVNWCQHAVNNYRQHIANKDAENSNAKKVGHEHASKKKKGDTVMVMMIVTRMTMNMVPLWRLTKMI
ncbi:hypothetical protein RFI_13029 [Reticulomyxa filosa]|uniref:Uncharacterized protein n=1 Tax=Reticulomyxa filosa TaxID=46433 RepID=X6NE16_RETFI|nr:hypothetical protein RFI_13029 [Reticulomyxa filosa]|eukprot:ETO24133.1 hypothetical protein RFI_13029 [Reticulomyxa filosa]